MLRSVPLLLLLGWPLWACSVPQFDAAKSAEPSTVEQLLAAGHYRRALALLTAKPTVIPAKQPAEVPDSAQHELLLSRTELGLGELDAALEFAEKALKLEPRSAAVHVAIAAAAGRLAEHANMFKQIGFAKRAKKELDEAIEIDSKNADALYGLVLFSNIAPPFLGGDKEKARQLAEKLAEIDPPRGYLAQAALAHQSKDVALEEMLLKKAVNAGPLNYEAHLAYAQFASQADPVRTDDADEQACLALELDPSRAAAWQVLTELAAKAQCGLEIDGLVRTAAQFNPDDGSPAYGAAVDLLASGKNLDQAETLLRAYLLKPQEGDAPSSGRARYQLALVLEQKGHRNQALDEMRLAVNEDPTLEDAKKGVKRLERPE